MFQPWLVEKLKITDTCGVHNLHGMPAVMGGLLSVLLAGIASDTEYDQYNDLDSPGATSSLTEIFPPSGLDRRLEPGQAGRGAAPRHARHPRLRTRGRPGNR